MPNGMNHIQPGRLNKRVSVAELIYCPGCILTLSKCDNFSLQLNLQPFYANIDEAGASSVLQDLSRFLSVETTPDRKRAKIVATISRTAMLSGYTLTPDSIHLQIVKIAVASDFYNSVGSMQSSTVIAISQDGLSTLTFKTSSNRPFLC